MAASTWKPTLGLACYASRPIAKLYLDCIAGWPKMKNEVTNLVVMSNIAADKKKIFEIMAFIYVITCILINFMNLEP
jgi:hypothetical protein